jgi:hypothetical protein
MPTIPLVHPRKNVKKIIEKTVKWEIKRIERKDGALTIGHTPFRHCDTRSALSDAIMI